MSVKINKITLRNEYFSFNALSFVTEPVESIARPIALLTHGYTASKSDLISWATRLSDAGISSIIFDLPGHLLGSFNEVNSFQTFTDHAVGCFILAHRELLKHIKHNPSHLILGGHSLGALLALKALELDAFKNLEKIAIAVGLGISQHDTVHLFNSSFYEKTLNIRRQLVYPTIDSEMMFPWISEQKENIEIILPYKNSV